MERRTLILGAAVVLLALGGAAAYALRTPPDEPVAEDVDVEDDDTGMSDDAQIELAKRIGYIQQDEE